MADKQNQKVKVQGKKPENSNDQKTNRDNLNQAVALFKSLSDRDKRMFARQCQIVPLVAVEKGKDVYPNHAGVLGRAVPAMSRLLIAQERAYNALAMRRVDIANADLQAALAEGTYFRPLDENENPIGDNPGLIEGFIAAISNQATAIYNALNAANVRPRHKSKRSRAAKGGASTEKTPATEVATASGTKEAAEASTEKAAPKKTTKKATPKTKKAEEAVADATA